MCTEYKYKGEETCTKYVELCKKGYMDVEIAAEFGCTVRAMELWTKKHEEFANARNLGRTMREASFHKFGRNMVQGHNTKGFQSWAWYMKNVFGYKDEQNMRVGLEAPEGGEIKLEIVTLNNSNNED